MFLFKELTSIFPNFLHKLTYRAKWKAFLQKMNLRLPCNIRLYQLGLTVSHRQLNCYVDNFHAVTFV